MATLSCNPYLAAMHVRADSYHRTTACMYSPQNLYPRMASHQRAVLLPGGWGSTSGPRGGAAQFKLNCSECYHCTPPGCPNCSPIVDMSCTSDPVSCSNLPGVNPGGSVYLCSIKLAFVFLENFERTGFYHAIHIVPEPP